MTRNSLALAALMILAPGAHAAVIFSDNFDASVGGLNVTPTGWTVTDGTVDVVNGGFCVAGQCVDLDGSTDNAGVLSHGFVLTGGVPYTASFDLSGNKRGGSDDVTIMFGTQSLVLTALPASAPYQTYTIPFTPSASGTYDLSFANAGGDNIGALLDNVVITSGTVSAVPEPSMLALMVAGCAGLRLRARRRAA